MRRDETVLTRRFEHYEYDKVDKSQIGLALYYELLISEALVYGTCKWKRLRRLIAKFHYTDTDTDTDFFVAKLRWVRAGPIRRKKVRVRVRVRVGPVSVSV